jgi:hypothetical protein
MKLRDRTLLKRVPSRGFRFAGFRLLGGCISTCHGNSALAHTETQGWVFGWGFISYPELWCNC